MKLLVMSGGRHPYHESTPVLEEFLKANGHEVSVTEDASVLTDAAAMGGLRRPGIQHPPREPA